jgi:hypothetical protein
MELRDVNLRETSLKSGFCLSENGLVKMEMASFGVVSENGSKSLAEEGDALRSATRHRTRQAPRRAAPRRHHIAIFTASDMSHTWQ